MSYCAIYLFPEKGDKVIEKEFRNAYGFSMRIVESLRNRYNILPDNWILKECIPMEKWFVAVNSFYGIYLKYKKPLYECEVITMATMFDCFVVDRKHFKQVADAWREFSGIHPGWEKIDHLPDMADFLYENADNELVHTMGIMGHSVSDDPFYDHEKERMMTVDDNGDNFHYFLREDFGWLI